jgi:hypothetical protein
MDSRDTEPREAAWGRVSEQFASLGETLRRRYEEQDQEQEAPDRQRSQESVQDALRSIGDAADRLATSVGSVIRDPAVKQEARSAAAALVDALSMTFSRLGEDVRRRMDRPSDDTGDSAWDTPPPQVEIVKSSETTSEAPTPPPRQGPDDPPSPSDNR